MGLKRHLDAAYEELLLETLGPDVHLLERWSDAARAASIAARRARAKGKDWRKAGRAAFYSKDNAGWGGETHTATSLKNAPHRAVISPHGKGWRAQAEDPNNYGGFPNRIIGYGRTPPEAGAAARRNAAGLANIYRKQGSFGRQSAKALVNAGRAFK